MTLKKIFGGLLTVVLAGSVLSIAPNPAIADIGPNPLVSLNLEKTFDGTGHGTDTATFMTSQNGFKPADDTATDNVVSSHDTVGYKMDLKIRAGTARTIVLDFTDNNLLNVDFDTFCYNFGAVSAKKVNSTCELTVPSGASGSLTANIVATAADTAGLIERDQALNISYGIKDSKTYGNVSAESVTIISAPRADLVIWPGTYPNKTAYKKNFSSAATGFFELIPQQLEYENTSSIKGVSTAGEYTATIDVSEWPATTVWTLGNTVIEVVDGKLNVKTTGKQKLSYNVPEGWEAAMPDFEKGSSRTLNISMVVDPNSFSSEDFKNNGTGFQPGDNKGQTETTFSAEYGSIAGSPFPNNDYSAIIINRESDPIAEVFSKKVFVPYSTGRSIFEDESRYWDEAQTEKESKNSSPRNVSLGTEFRQELFVYTKNLTEVPETTQVGFTVTDSWNSSHQKLDSARPITVEDSEGKVINSNLYTITYSDTKDADHTNESLWSSTPSDNSQSLRVVFKSAIKHGANGSNMKVIVHSIVNEDLTSTNWGEDADLVRDKFRGYLIGEGISETVEKESMIDGSVRAVWLGTPELELTHSNDVTPNESTPGSTVDFEINRIRSSNIPVMSEGVPAKIELTLDNCVSNPIFDSATQKNYTITYTPAIPGSDGKICGSVDATPGKVVFTGKTSENLKVSSKINDNGYVALPTIKYSVDISKSANGTVTNNAVFTWNDVDAEVIPVSDESAVNVALTIATTQVITSVIPKTEINKTVSFKVDTTDNNAEGQRGSVIVLPRNGDTVLLNGLKEDSRNDYLAAGFPEGSDFNGSYSVKNISIDASQSSDSVLYYTTDANPDLSYEGKNWYLVSEAGQNGNPSLSEATAVYLEMETELGSNKNSTVLIDLDTTGNVKDDVYVLWSNGIRSGDNVVQDNPWPANAVVVSSSIAGTVWWDENRDSAVTVDGDTPETGIEGVTVSLFEADENGEPVGSAIATRVTDAAGKYLFDSLNSGNYIVEIVDKGENLPESVNSEIYNNELDVEQTYSYKNKKLDSSGIRSQVVELAADSNMTEVDYGFFAPNPVVDVDKSVAGTECFASYCEITYNVKITNNGNTAVNNGYLTDVASNSLVDLETVVGEYYDEKVIETVNRLNNGSTYALTESGKVYSWGIGVYGSNGNGSSAENLIAKPVLGLEDVKVKKVYAKDIYRGFALTDNGELYSWGTGAAGALGLGSTSNSYTAQKISINEKVVSLEIKYTQGAFAITESGKVYSWGIGTDGINGVGTTDTRTSPTLINGLNSEKIVDVKTVGSLAVALTDTGKVYAWGSGSEGQTGSASDMANGTATLTPNLVPGFENIKIKQIIARANGAYAIDEDNDLYSWGSGANYANGDGTTNNISTPYRIPLDNVQEIAIRESTTAGVINGAIALSNNTVYAWGIGNNHANGAGVTGNITNPEPRVVAGLSNNITNIYARHNGGFALSNDGSVYAWGLAQYGQLGINSISNAYTATKVLIPQNEVVSELHLRGTAGAYALTESGNIYGWGSNNGYNAFGEGSIENMLSPVAMIGTNEINIKSIQAKTTFGLTLIDDEGIVYTVGYGNRGGAANGTNDVNTYLTKAIGLTNLFSEGSGAAPISENKTSDFTERTYKISKIPAGETLGVQIKAKVQQSENDGVAVNQAWFTSENTPFSGIINKDKPDYPVAPSADSIDSVGVLGNLTCNIGDGVENQGKYPNTSANSTIDMCDQVASLIPGLGVELGSISGYVWDDKSRNNYIDSNDVFKSGVEVSLYTPQGIVLATTTTDENGYYKFENTIPGEAYRVFFNIKGLDAGEGKTYGYVNRVSVPTLNRSMVIPSSGFTLNFRAPSTGDLNQLNVNAGVYAIDSQLTVEKTSRYGEPAEVSLNTSGDYVNVANGEVIGKTIPVDVRITNTGDEPLSNISFNDMLIQGPDVTNWICRLSGTEINDSTVLQPNAYIDCTGELSGLNASENIHEDNVEVTGIGEVTGITVSGEDDWSATFVENDPMWTVSKTSSIASGETIGTTDEVTYTLTAENTGTVAVNDLVIKDSMKHVLDNAELITDSLDESLTYNEDTSELTWNIASIPPSETATVSYTVKVNDVLSEDRVMLNYITDGGSSVKPDVCFDATEFENINGPLYSMDDVDTTELIEGCYTIHEVVDHNSPELPSLGGKGVLNYIIIGTILLIVSAGVYFGMTRKSARN